MNKKVLGLLAASAAVASTAIFASPARAVKQEVNVNLTVDEVLYLRTFSDVELRVSQSELGNGDSAAESDARGTTDGTNLLDVTEVSVGDESDETFVTKEVKELYAVYSNGDADDIKVQVTVDPSGKTLTNTDDDDFTAEMSVVDDDIDSDRIPDDLDYDGGDEAKRIGGVELRFDFFDDGDEEAPQAGRYEGGVIVVEAISQGDFSTDGDPE
ncbi:MAG: hypothetical protein WBF90_36730 [Rivularia sp. (in: cyanobacteria)]